MALDHSHVYEHATAKDFLIRTTSSFDEAMSKTTGRELHLYFPNGMNYEYETTFAPDVIQDAFYAWAKKPNFFSEHTLRIGVGIDYNRLFHDLVHARKLFAIKIFMVTFTLDSLIDKLHQNIDQNPVPQEINILKKVVIQLAALCISNDGSNLCKPCAEIPSIILKKMNHFLSSYNALMNEGDQLFSSKYMTYNKKVWARLVQSAAEEVLHKLDQQVKGLSIDPWFWGGIRPYSGGLILTGSVLFADELKMPDVNDPLQHDIHMVNAYDNELMSFHKEQSQSHFNMINGLMRQGLSRELVFMTWARRRNIHCRDVEALVQGNKGSLLEECYRILFRYQLELFNYHIWTPHRYGWNKA